MLREKPEFYKEEIRCGYTVDEKIEACMGGTAGNVR